MVKESLASETRDKNQDLVLRSSQEGQPPPTETSQEAQPSLHTSLLASVPDVYPRTPDPWGCSLEPHPIPRSLKQTKLFRKTLPPKAASASPTFLILKERVLVDLKHIFPYKG